MSLVQLRNLGIVANAGIATTKLGTGAVLQVVSTTKTDTFTTSANEMTDVTGLSVSITPSSSSNKILVLLSLTIAGQNTVSGAGYQLVRGSTAIGIGTAVGNRLGISGGIAYIAHSDSYTTVAGSFLDSPSTTSATTYKVQVGKSMTVYVNRTQNDQNLADIYSARTASTITVMEIKG